MYIKKLAANKITIVAKCISNEKGFVIKLLYYFEKKNTEPIHNQCGALCS